MYRITETATARAHNRKSIEQARNQAYDAIHRLTGGKDQSYMGKAYLIVHDWQGKHTVLRYGSNAVTLETL